MKAVDNHPRLLLFERRSTGAPMNIRRSVSALRLKTPPTDLPVSEDNIWTRFSRPPPPSPSLSRAQMNMGIARAAVQRNVNRLEYKEFDAPSIAVPRRFVGRSVAAVPRPIPQSADLIDPHRPTSGGRRRRLVRRRPDARTRGDGRSGRRENAAEGRLMPQWEHLRCCRDREIKTFDLGHTWR